MERGDKKQQQLQQHLMLAKSSRQQRSSEWIFRDVPSDIIVEVSGRTYALHKFPLVSRSGRIRKLVAERREPDISKMELHHLPGGAEAFELAAKFCYGINFEITPTNVAQLCCVSDYLEMNEEFSKDNLGSRAEEYLDSVICRSLEMSVQVLNQCETLIPLADELGIANRCIDSVASKACAEQIASSFSRLEYSSSGRLQMSRAAAVKCEGDWWIEDLSVLNIDLFYRVLSAMKCRGVRPESIGASLVSYVQNELSKRPALWNPRTQSSRPDVGHERLVVETVVSLLPVERLVVPISFLFGLLRSAVLLGCSGPCRLELERRIGSQLDMATLDDVLIPSASSQGGDTATMFDVDTVYRILVNFSQQDESEDDASGFESDDSTPHSPSQTALFKVSKLVDNYLVEIASDANLKLIKFLVVAEALPSHARAVHDGLYRAIDVYLKAHQGLSEADKRRLCKMIDFQKLSQEAGAHAAQNERLPLQSVVQVLYFEQLKLRNSMFCSSFPEEEPKPLFQSWRVNSGALSACMSPKDNYASLRRENRELKLELARMRMRLNDLEKDHVSMKITMRKSGSRRFMSSFSKKIGRMSFFGHGSSRNSSSGSKVSPRSDSKVTDTTF